MIARVAVNMSGRGVPILVPPAGDEPIDNALDSSRRSVKPQECQVLTCPTEDLRVAAAIMGERAGASIMTSQGGQLGIPLQCSHATSRPERTESTIGDLRATTVV